MTEGLGSPHIVVKIDVSDLGFTSYAYAWVQIAYADVNVDYNGTNASQLTVTVSNSKGNNFVSGSVIYPYMCVIGQ